VHYESCEKKGGGGEAEVSEAIWGFPLGGVLF
jgi:hypothetical protein